MYKRQIQAYPKAKENVLKDYKQDSICGTWEVLANAVYEGGLKKMRAECPTYREIGKYKAEWADKVGSYMVIERNVSPSFQYFIEQINKRINIA